MFTVAQCAVFLDFTIIKFPVLGQRSSNCSLLAYVDSNTAAMTPPVSL